MTTPERVTDEALAHAEQAWLRAARNNLPSRKRLFAEYNRLRDAAMDAAEAEG